VPVRQRARKPLKVRTPLLLIVAVAALSGAGLAVRLPATATPASQVDLERLGTQIDVLDEQLNQAIIQLAPLNQQLAMAKQAVRQQQANLGAIQRLIGAQAADEYKGGGVDLVAALFAGNDSRDLIDKAELLDLLAQRNNNLLNTGVALKNLYDQAVAQANAARAAQLKIVKQIAAKRNLIERKLTQLQHLRSLIGDPASVPLPSNLAIPIGPAGVAVRTVLAQLGKPYHWGAAGPSSFDCSGLTMYSWGKAGVSMPHSASAQYQMFPHLARANLQAGDLVFFGSPIHHVGMYIGQNLMVAAPSTGRLVQVQTLVGRSDYVGAARP
jgi:cell wall-associated NlpC family hydrolase